MSRKITPQMRMELADRGLCTACAIRPVHGRHRQCLRCRQAECLKRKNQDRHRHPNPQHLRAFGVARELLNAALDFSKALRENRATREHAAEFLSAARLYEYEYSEAMKNKLNRVTA